MSTETITRKLTAVCIDDEFGPFPALVRTDYRWNGWAVPIFPMDSVLLIKRILDNSRQDPDAANIITIDDEGVWELCTAYRDEATDARGDKVAEIVVDGVTYYAVGDSWCWDETTVFCSECQEEFEYAELKDLTRPYIDPCVIFLCKDCEVETAPLSEAVIATAKPVGNGVVEIDGWRYCSMCRLPLIACSGDDRRDADFCMMDGCNEKATTTVNWAYERFNEERAPHSDRRCAKHAKDCASGQPNFGRYNIVWGDDEVTITYVFTQADEDKFLAAFPQHRRANA